MVKYRIHIANADTGAIAHTDATFSYVEAKRAAEGSAAWWYDENHPLDLGFQWVTPYFYVCDSLHAIYFLEKVEE